MVDRIQEPFAFVIFGASGDLSRRKLIPALYHLGSLGYMPEKYAVIGTSRSPMSDEAFRGFVKEALEEHAKEDKAEGSPQADALTPHAYFQAGDTTKLESFQALKTKLEQLDEHLELHGNRLFYLAVAPDLVPGIIEKLHDAGMLRQDRH